MLQQITKGIKIIVSSNFEGTILKNYEKRFVFAYSVTIKNTSNDTVQLISRHWEVLDSLNSTEIIDGEGVLGKKPVLKPGETHQYNSGCLLTSPIGLMKGYYNMISLSTTNNFKVLIPNIKLSAPFTLN